MLRYFMYFLLLSASMTFAMDDQAQKAKSALSMTLKGLSELHDLIKEHGIKETLDTFLIDSYPEKIAHFLAQYPLALQVIEESRESRAEKRSLKIKTAHYITSRPDDFWSKARLSALISTAVAEGILIAYIMSFDPTSTEFKRIFAACFAIGMYFALSKIGTSVYSSMTAQKNSPESAALKIANIALQLMPLLPAINKVLKLSEMVINTAVNVEALDFYEKFILSLSDTQKDLVKNYKLILSAIDPEAIIGELALLGTLSDTQLYYVYFFLKLSDVKVSEDFTTFTAMLSDTQKIITPPTNRCLLAEYNPAILIFDGTFMEKLDAKQTAFLKSLVPFFASRPHLQSD